LIKNKNNCWCCFMGLGSWWRKYCLWWKFYSYL